MQTANRNHANRPSIFTGQTSLAALAIAKRQNTKSPAYSLADALKHGGMILAALVVLGAIF